MIVTRTLNVGLIGAGFMGRAHSNAWSQVNKFFDLPMQVVMRAVCSDDLRQAQAFARRWGWAEATSRLADLLKDESIDLIDVCTPNHLHAEQSIAAIEAGKIVACEKPLAGTLVDARSMRDAAKKPGARSRQRRGARTFVWFNYRRCPAIALAHQFVRQGRLGRIYHVRAAYLQDWGGPGASLTWRFQSRLAGSGAHGDLNAHLVDMARFITGDEIVEVSGAVEKTFIDERKNREAASGGRGTASGKRRSRVGRSTVDDCVLFLARFGGGAVASFEATRLATGNANRNCIEINGERGSIKFDFERMNELMWWDETVNKARRGWSRILCTTPGAHPYVEAYWPRGHGLGYEHQFISQAADMIRVIGGGKPVVPLPDFEDAYQTQRVLEAALIAARQRRPVRMSEIS